jgi:hypothetical protein
MNKINKFSIDIDSLSRNQIYVSPNATGTGDSVLDPIDINSLKPKLIPFAHNEIILLQGNHVLFADINVNTMKRDPVNGNSGEGGDINFFLNFEDFPSVELRSFDRNNMAILMTEHTTSGYISENTTGGTTSASANCTAHNYDETTICFHNCRNFILKDIKLYGNSSLKVYSSTGVVQNVYCKHWSTVSANVNLYAGVQAGIDIFNSTVQILTPPEFEQSPNYYDENVNGGLHITDYYHNLGTESHASILKTSITIRNNGNLVQETPAMITFKGNRITSTRHKLIAIHSHTNSSVRMTNILVHNINQVYWVGDSSIVYGRTVRMNATSDPINGIGIVYDKAKLDFGTDNDWNSANVLRVKGWCFQDNAYTGAENDGTLAGFILNAYRYGIVSTDCLVVKVVETCQSYFNANAGADFYCGLNMVVKPDNVTTHGATSWGIQANFSATFMLWAAAGNFHEITTKTSGVSNAILAQHNATIAIGPGNYVGTNLYTKSNESYLWINGVVY